MHAYLTRVWEAAMTDFQKAADAAAVPEQP